MLFLMFQLPCKKPLYQTGLEDMALLVQNPISNPRARGPKLIIMEINWSIPPPLRFVSGLSQLAFQILLVDLVDCLKLFFSPEVFMVGYSTIWQSIGSCMLSC